MAQNRGIRIHQYLDDWLLRAPCQETCLQYTQILLALYRKFCWMMNITKSELVPQQKFIFVGYHFNLYPRAECDQLRRVGPVYNRRFTPQKSRYLFIQTVYVPDKVGDSHGEASSVGSAAHEAFSVASKETLACSKSLAKVIHLPKALHPHLDW